MNNSVLSKIVIGLAILGIIWFVVSFYIDKQSQTIQSAIEDKITEQEKTVSSIARSVSRSEADSVVNLLITDCPIEERERFDQLLGNLSQLNSAELSEIRGLFDTCGSYYEDARAIMTARLNREISQFSTYVELLSSAGADTTKYDSNVTEWFELGEIETERSGLMSKLVSIQDEIIELLIAGESIESEVIKKALEEAQTTKETLLILSSNAEELRLKLSSV